MFRLLSLRITTDVTFNLKFLINYHFNVILTLDHIEIESSKWASSYQQPFVQTCIPIQCKILLTRATILQQQEPHSHKKLSTARKTSLVVEKTHPMVLWLDAASTACRMTSTMRISLDAVTWFLMVFVLQKRMKTKEKVPLMIKCYYYWLMISQSQSCLKSRIILLQLRTKL